MQIFDQNHGLTPWQKANFCSVFLRHFYHLENFIFYLEHHERLFPDLFDLKTQDKKNANFRPKPWTNPLPKMQIFPLFKFDIFIIQIGSFSI